MAPRRPPAPLPHPDAPFAAIDFETADHGADSACAVGIVRVEGRAIVAREKVLVRPPRPQVLFSWLHGITWDMVKGSPTFGEAWPRFAPLLDGVEFLAAHNAPFDRRVLLACCVTGNVPPPPQPFVCTVQVARRHWGLKPNDLASVCRRLGIGLIHHDPLSDAEACARILLAATHQAPPVRPGALGDPAKA